MKGHGLLLARRPQHVLTGLVQCGQCGATFATVGRNYLRCRVNHAAGPCDNRRSVWRDRLQQLALDALGHDLMRPDALADFT
jgi:hypothetical protein